MRVSPTWKYTKMDTVHYFRSGAGWKSSKDLEKVLQMLENYQARLPTVDELKKLGLPKTYLEDVKKLFSSYQERLPLYDAISNAVYLVYWENLFTRIHQDHYRMITKDFVESMKKSEHKSEEDEENLYLISLYDLDVLQKTYLRVFYESFATKNSITSCRRASYYPGMRHISPYYSTVELLYLSRDWNLLKKDERPDMKKLCHQIRERDIPASVLLAHQLYIYESGAIGLIKHYSLTGSYMLNSYLRQTKILLVDQESELRYRNPFLEKQIEHMIRFISKAPAFQKEYTVYRVIKDDTYLRHLKVGDVYVDPSFTSTARNPFHSDNTISSGYDFGFTMLRIKIPAGIPGIGICMESYSNFPFEQEIVLMPTCGYKLQSVSNVVEDYHEAFGLKVLRKYDFICQPSTVPGFDGKGTIKLHWGEMIKPNIETVDLEKALQDVIKANVSLRDRVDYFLRTYPNGNNHFHSVIGNTRYLFSVEQYVSNNTAYEMFYFYEQTNGLCITSSDKEFGNLNIMIEIGDSLHVNYYFRYSVTDLKTVIDLDNPDWIQWLSLLCALMGCKEVIIHDQYILKTCQGDSERRMIEKTKHTIPSSPYRYLKDGFKQYQYNFVTSRFEHSQLDSLRKLPVKKILNPKDRDQLYKLWARSKLEYVGEFYIYLVENYPSQRIIFENKLASLFSVPQNPFLHLSYLINAWGYLIQKGLVKYRPILEQFPEANRQFKKPMDPIESVPEKENRIDDLAAIDR